MFKLKSYGLNKCLKQIVTDCWCLLKVKTTKRKHKKKHWIINQFFWKVFLSKGKHLTLAKKNIYWLNIENWKDLKYISFFKNAQIEMDFSAKGKLLVGSQNYQCFQKCLHLPFSNCLVNLIILFLTNRTPFGHALLASVFC